MIGHGRLLLGVYDVFCILSFLCHHALFEMQTFGKRCTMAATGDVPCNIIFGHIYQLFIFHGLCSHGRSKSSILPLVHVLCFQLHKGNNLSAL